VTPSQRAGRPVTNPSDLADGFLGVSCKDGVLTLTIWNFGDLLFENVEFSASEDGASLTPINVPNSAEGDTWAQATYIVSNGECPSFTAQVNYTNSLTGSNETLKEINAIPPLGR
jgi:hypothetical protein